MRFQRVERDALFISTELSVPRAAWVLPRGTLVGLPPTNPPSPVLGAPERYVIAPDSINRPWRGWLASNAPLGPVRKRDVPGWLGKEKLKPLGPKLRAPVWVAANGRELILTAWDDIRERIIRTPPRRGVDKKGQPIDAWTLLPWLSRFGREHEDLLAAALTELTGKSVKSVEPDELSRRLIKVTMAWDIPRQRLHQERRQLLREEKRRAALAAVKQKARRAPSPDTSAGDSDMTTKTQQEKPKRSMARTVGQALLKAKVPALQPAAKKLMNGGLNHSELAKLRDAVNDAASRARERKQASLASQLSSVNRLVRRLERASRGKKSK